MSDWLHGLRELGRRGETAALVTVLETRGSTPREPGAKMAVGLEAARDSIGGGQLEHAAIESARLLIETGGGYANEVERHELGPSLGQCCGGVATLLIERIPAGAAWLDALDTAGRDNVTAVMATAVGGGAKQVFRDGDDLPAGGIAPLVKRALDTGEPVLGRAEGTRWFIDPVPPADCRIALFGAGHVGKAVAGVLATLPCELTWIDSRPEQFPDRLAANVRTRIAREPESLVDDCPPGAYYLVMTHSHPLDLAVCERILGRGDFAYCGLIGSVSKRRNFEKRLRLKGITELTLNRLTCPIGIDGIGGKRPAEIAVAVAAQVLQVWETARRETGPGSARTSQISNNGSPLPQGEGPGNERRLDPVGSRSRL